MKQILSYNSSFMRLLENVTNVWLLHFCMLLTSLPVVTIGASLMAGNAVMARIYDNQETKVIHDYWHYFKANLKQGVAWSLIVAAVLLVLFFDLKYLIKLPVVLHLVFGNLLIVLAIFALAILSMLPPYLSRYAETIGHATHNLLIILLHHVGWCALLVLASIFPLILLMAGSVGIWTLIFWFTFLGFGVCVWLQSLIFKQIVARVEPSAV
ncbi:YesL family protein [Lacticaseibacillus mingshuiensis]|uniref:DUF624 domain-containing protein n=1 Tax=Lacticaseibacillus mingshuiensis TaxID=2799574 RepID=A0ABW4CJQ6_9LACO|nr:YesL family protein [Lacticaseibacillus mingshuiensis]